MPGTCPVGHQVEVEEIEWLFYPFIPYGKVTIIQGDPGEGKTTVVLQIIAKLTKGEAIDLYRQRGKIALVDLRELGESSISNVIQGKVKKILRKCTL